MLRNVEDPGFVALQKEHVRYVWTAIDGKATRQQHTNQADKQFLRSPNGVSHPLPCILHQLPRGLSGCGKIVLFLAEVRGSSNSPETSYGSTYKLVIRLALRFLFQLSS